MSISDNELIACFIEHANSVFAFLDRKLPNRYGSQISTEDILQEVWLTAFRYFQEHPTHSLLNNKEEMLKWLIRVSERKLIDTIRHMRTIKRGGNFQKHSNRNTSYCNLIELLRAEERSPSSEEAVKEAVNILQIALCTLPDDTRRAVVLRHLDEHSNESIAKELDRSVPAIKGLIQRGMRKLRIQLGSQVKYFNDPVEESDKYQQPVREAR